MKRFCGVLVAVAAMACATSAAAAGVMIDDSALAPADRAALRGEVAAAHKADPDAFRAVALLRGQIAARDEHKRGRLATVTAELTALGARGVPAILSELAVSGGRGALVDGAWLAWRLDLLEAIGTARDARSAAVLEAILASPESDFLLVRGASEALGKLGTSTVAVKLVALSRQGSNAHQIAVMAGMGHCRRPVVVERLAEAMSSAAASSGLREAKHLAHALGDAGSAWAWQTGNAGDAKDEPVVRAAAAEALVTAFAAISDSAVRSIVSQAVLVVDDASTKSLIAAARQGATADTKAALDDLEQRFDHNPTR